MLLVNYFSNKQVFTQHRLYTKEGVSKAQKRPQYKSKLATLVKYT